MNKDSPRARSYLLEFLGGPEQYEAYEKCKNHQQRVAMIYQIPMVQALFQQQKQMLKSENTGPTCKNDRESKRLRDLGNQAFKNARDRKALELYTEAVCYADPNGKEQALGLALANRSAVLIKFPGRKNAQKAIKDINRALKAGHPSPIKLMERKLNCQLKLNNVQDAKKTIDELLKEPDLDGAKTKEFKAKFEALKEAENGHHHDEEQNEVHFASHPNYPSLNSCVKIKYEKNRGRFAIAGRDIKVGEVLIFESPTGAKLKKGMVIDHCENCLKSCQGHQVPCPRCTEVRFCSEECLQEAESSYHPYECRANSKNVTAFFEDFLMKVKGQDGAVNFYRLLLKLIAQKPLKFFLDHQQSIQNPQEDFAPKNATSKKIITQPLKSPITISEDESFATEDTFYGGSYKGLLSLVRHGDQDAPSGLFWIILSAVFHLRTLQITGYFGAEIATCTTKRQLTSVELFIAATLIDIFQLLRYNTHAVIEHQFDEGPKCSDDWQRWKNKLTATAIYPTLALLNHSCDANIRKYFLGSSVVVVAVRSILKGEEICENYFPIFTRMPRDVRRPWLLQHYCFDCNCEACQRDFPTFEGLKSMKTLPWKCPDCHQLLEEDLKCKQCNMSVDSQALQQSYDKTKEAIMELKSKTNSPQELNEETIKDIYQKTCQLQDQLSQLVGSNNDLVVETTDFLHALMSRLLGNKVEVI